MTLITANGKRLVAVCRAHPRCKNLSPSRVIAEHSSLLLGLRRLEVPVRYNRHSVSHEFSII